MGSTSKVKNNNTSNLVTAAEMVTSSNVVSAGEAAIFSALFDKIQIQDVSAQAGTDSRQDSQQNQPQARDTDQTNGLKKSGKAEKSDSGDNVDGENKTREANEDEELSEEEKSQLEEIEKYRMSLEQLAGQLNVALSTVRDEGPQYRNVKIIVESEVQKVQNAMKEIDPNLLRKVDIESLNNHLDKLTTGRDLLDVDVPVEDVEVAQAFDDIMSEAYRPDLNNEEQELQLNSESNDMNASLLDQEAVRSMAGDDFENRMLALNAKNRELREGDVQIEIESKNDLPADSFLDRMADSGESKIPLENIHQSEGPDSNKITANADFFAESLKVLTDRSQLDLRQTVSEKSYTFMAGADATPQTGPATPQVVETLHLTGVSVRQADDKGVALHLGAKAPEKIDLGADDLVKIKSKVEMLVLDMSKNGKVESTRIQLHPETLGKIDIKITMKEKMVSAEIVTDNEVAREAVMQHLPQIREALASENLMLDYFNARHDGNHFQDPRDHSFAAFYGDGERRSPHPEQSHAGGESLLRAADKGLANRAAHAAKDSILNITV